MFVIFYFYPLSRKSQLTTVTGTFILTENQSLSLMTNWLLAAAAGANNSLTG